MYEFYRYEKYQKYINGVPADPPEYKQGELIGIGEYNNILDCMADAIYRWVDNGKTVCKEYSLYNQEKKQKSLDKGVTWTDTGEVRDGNKVIEQYAEECGWRLLTRWEKTGKTVCDGYNLSEEYVKQESWDMGKTWQNSVPEEYKYEVSEYLAKECILQAEPLTYKITLNDPNSTISFKTVVSGVPGKYYVRWGDAFDYIEEVTISKHFDATVKSHEYEDAGEYTVEIWSIPITIGDVILENGTFDIAAWGYSSYTEEPDRPVYPLPSYGGFPTSVILDKSYAGSIVEDSHQTFQYLENFQHHGQRLTVIPPKLFQYARKLEKSSFSNTSVKLIPSNLYINTNQTDFTSVCQDCKELETIEQDSFASVKGTKHYDMIQYYSGDYPATRCMKCFKEGNMERALTDCQNVIVAAGYYKNVPDTTDDELVSIAYTSPTQEQLKELYRWYGAKRYRPFIQFADRYYIGSQVGWNDNPPIPEWNPRNGVLFTEDEYWVNWHSNHIGSVGIVYGTWSVRDDINKGIQYFAYSSGLSPEEGQTIYGSCIFKKAFSGCTKLHTVEALIQNTQYVADTSYMFEDCVNLESVDDFLTDCWLGEEKVGSTKQVLTFDYTGMFKGCTSLKAPIDISTNTKYVEPFKYFSSLKFNNQDTPLSASISLDYMYSGAGITQYNNLALSPPSIYNVTSRYMFSDCPNLESFTNSNLTIVESEGMFTNSQKLTTVNGIHFVNAQSAFKDCVSLTTVNDVHFVNAQQAFKDCISLTTLNDVTFTGNIEYCFQNCTSLVTVPDTLFPNEQKDLIANHAFKGCTALTSIPNTLISNTVPEEDNLEIYKMFEHSGLQSYPIDDGKAIWQWERFYEPNDPSTYQKTLAFYGCMDIIDEVPVRWGGLVDIDKNMSPLILEIDSNTVTLNLSASDEMIILTNDGQYITVNSGTTTINSESSPLIIKIYYLDGTWRVTSNTYYKILDFGGDGMIDSYSDPDYITYLGTDWGVFKATTKFPLTNLRNVEGVSVDFLKSGTNINSVEELFRYNKKLTSIPEGTFSKLTNLSGADRVLQFSNIENVDGMFEGCTNLIDAYAAFDECPNLTSAQRTFKDCTSLSAISNIFGSSSEYNDAVNCNQLFENTAVTGFYPGSFMHLSSAIGMFRNNSKLTEVEPNISPNFTLVGDNVDLTEMFKDCPLLDNNENQIVFTIYEGSTANFTRCWQNCAALSYIPKVEYGQYNYVYPWEVPNAVGTECFNGCTSLLEKYGDQIPDGWK